jgi:hypothetical protein
MRAGPLHLGGDGPLLIGELMQTKTFETNRTSNNFDVNQFKPSEADPTKLVVRWLMKFGDPDDEDLDIIVKGIYRDDSSAGYYLGDKYHCGVALRGNGEEWLVGSWAYSRSVGFELPEYYGDDTMRMIGALERLGCLIEITEEEEGWHCIHHVWISPPKTLSPGDKDYGWLSKAIGQYQLEEEQEELRKENEEALVS